MTGPCHEFLDGQVKLPQSRANLRTLLDKFYNYTQMIFMLGTILGNAHSVVYKAHAHAGMPTTWSSENLHSLQLNLRAFLIS